MTDLPFVVDEAAPRLLLRKKRAPRAAEETDLVKKLLVELSARGWLVWRNNSGALYVTIPAGKRGARPVYYRGRLVKFGQEGTPDIIGFCRCCGAFLGIEAKSKRGTRRAMQKVFAEQAQRAGVVYACVKTVDQAVRAVAAHRCRRTP